MSDFLEMVEGSISVSTTDLHNLVFSLNDGSAFDSGCWTGQNANDNMENTPQN